VVFSVFLYKLLEQLCFTIRPPQWPFEQWPLYIAILHEESNFRDQ